MTNIRDTTADLKLSFQQSSAVLYGNKTLKIAQTFVTSAQHTRPHEHKSIYVVRTNVPEVRNILQSAQEAHCSPQSLSLHLWTEKRTTNPVKNSRSL
ncbi:hypothetical protein VZT92_021664 [Zoarces viviparus]|uniref:Uncharacterized protein n=1 Tax=Zoarces viviparus TaxID=48416 RepID=A0AAW1E9N2_ZOAVI